MDNQLSYLNQPILARKTSPVTVLQITGNYAHFNQIDHTSVSDNTRAVFGVTVCNKFGAQLSNLIEYDYPDKTPGSIETNLSVGKETVTITQAFHVFASVFSVTGYQRNLMFNNEFSSVDLLIEFNITRNWSF